MILLGLSTSTPRGSVAVARDGAPAAAAAYVDLQGHAERLFHAVDEALAAAGAARAALGAIACDVGPGSFTGVRVGVASAKGIAVALGLPLVGVVSLEAMAAAAFAEGAAAPEDTVIAALDAKKGEIFAAAYRASGACVIPPETRPLAGASLDLAGAGRVVIVGEIAASLALPAGARLARGPALDLPDAAWIARIAARRLAEGDRGGAEDVEPLYVRAPDATPMAPV